MKNYLLYAMPALPLALLGLPLYIYLPTFYAQDVGLSIFGVGLVLLFARVFDMFLDPLIGYWSDAYFSRKVFMFLGMLFLLIGFYFLTHPVQDAALLWLFSFSMLVYFGWSLIAVPYYAIGADAAQSYEQNTTYASYRELFNVLGVLCALLIPYIFGVADNPTEALLLLSETIFYSLPIVLALFFLGFDAQRIQNHFRSLRSSLLLFYSELKTSKYLFGAFLLNNLANALPATLFLLYVELVIGAKEQAGVLLLAYFVSGIVALYFWNILASKTSKKFAWSLSMLNATVFFSFVPFLGEGDFNLFLLITIATGLSLGADMALPASMQADIVQNTQSAPREMGGTLFGFFAMLVKLSLALGVGISFTTLGAFGFDATSPNESSFLPLVLLYSLLPVILKLFAIYLLSAYKES